MNFTHKIVQKKDFAGKIKARGVRTHWELKQLMTVIDNTAKTKGVVPIMTQMETNQCFTFEHDGLNIPLITPSGRPCVVSDFTWRFSLKHTQAQALIGIQT